MTFFHSVRTRLTLWYTAWLGATLLTFGAISYFVTRQVLIENLDRSLHSEVKWVNEFIEPKAKKVRLKRAALRELQELKKTASTSTPTEEELREQEERAEVDAMWNQIYQHTLLTPRRHFIQILDRNNDLLYRSPSLGKSQIKYDDIPYANVHITTIRNPELHDLRLAVMQNDYVKIFVAFPFEPVNEVLDSLFANFGIIAPIALLLSVIGGWFLAHKSLKPVDALTRAAREITAQNLNRRLPAHHVDDEIGRLTAQFNDMIGRLHASFSQIRQFSADASHELRTPLTIMRGEIEVALRGPKMNDQTRTLLLSIHDELVRLSNIVESLMSLVKSDSGTPAFNFQEISLTQILEQIVADARLLAERKNISVTLGSLDRINVNGDPTRLRQLFLNLVDNAVKYTPENGSIGFSLHRVNGSAVVRVQDSGIGIRRKDLAKIFDRFYRGDQSRDGDRSGSGLGLSIAKWIVETHQGTIEVTSREKKGSTFTVTLPLSSNNH
ncbi:MAG: HAMP domain-containing histidine kinase [Ignavibacteriales bacterium]|nr:HAMP domain-containing histidine kinase [Ignavibacteriales bacterium]